MTKRQLFLKVLREYDTSMLEQQGIEELMSEYDAAEDGEYQRGFNDGAEAARNSHETAANS